MLKRTFLIVGIACLLLVLAFLLSYFVFQVPLFDASGWHVAEDGTTQYLDYYGRPRTGWVTADDRQYYFGDDTAMHTGWLQLEEGTYHFAPDGAMQTGWQQLDGNHYYFGDDGIAHTGWLQTPEGKYYFGADFCRHTGWLEKDDARYYFAENGQMQIGWLDWEGKRYYLNADGAMHTGWLQMEDGRYYLASDGVMHTGWLEQDGKRYYLEDDGKTYVGWLTQEDGRYFMDHSGAATTGFATIEGQQRYFLDNGQYIPLVNPWNPVPADYQLQLVEVNGYKVDSTCAQALKEFLAACRKAGNTVKINSAYRDLKQQQAMWDKYRKNYMAQGYSYDKAEELTAGYVAVPGTSEHHLGLGIDIGSGTKTYNWLAKHCWEYGFILRYPKDKKAATGINYEPWHFRYLGKEMAKAVYDSGLTLEEYLESIQ